MRTINRRLVLALVLIVLVSGIVIASAPAATAYWVPVMPGDCADTNWNSPGEVFDCLTSILGDLFGGWCGWVID
jgi:hypothetical protein